MMARNNSKPLLLKSQYKQNQSRHRASRLWGIPVNLITSPSASKTSASSPQIQTPQQNPTPSAEPEAAPVSAVAPASYAKVETWRARKGEPVREVLKRWSQREGTELMWASGDAPNLPKDFSFVGPLDLAVAALL